MVNETQFVRSIKLSNFLSYGSLEQETELKSLNVLIGPNLSGKSNLLEAVSLLRATSRDLAEPIRQGGGVSEWIWKGAKHGANADVEVILGYPPGTRPLRYHLTFAVVGQRLELIDEALEDRDRRHSWEDDVYFYYRYQHGRPVLNVPTTHSDTGEAGPPRRRNLKREDLDPDQSVLSQRKDPDQYPELTYVATQFSKMKLYREWTIGRSIPPRIPQTPDMAQDFLSEDGKNLALVLNDLEHRPGVKHELIRRLRDFCSRIDDFTVRIAAGTVQLFLHEKGLMEPLPATRLSDGTLRYLCLLSILCHPDPPALICIEEPELGLHPDALKSVAEMLIDASHRTQLIVTTHSDALVSGLSQVPDSVIVCERADSGTVLRRLDHDALQDWLSKYTLGELWRMGEIGGNP